jgi:vacuolar-type H+-ATPase subunit H
MSTDRANPAQEDAADALPRTDVDLESQLEGLREWVKGHTTLLNHCFLDVEEFDERVEHVIALIPKEIRRAKRITREEQRIIQDAKDEARRQLEEARAEADQILTSAREEAERLVEASAIRQRALEQAEATIARAQESARDIRVRSHAYAQQVIGNVLASLDRLQQSVQGDKAQLEQMNPENE